MRTIGEQPDCTPLVAQRVSSVQCLEYLLHRRSRAFRHCADVLSFANNSNVVSDLSTRVTDICSRWVQSATRDYDVILATTIDAEWAGTHKPVLSRQGQGHTLYTQSLLSEPGGKLVICHSQCEAQIDWDERAGSIRFKCSKCSSRCSTELIKSPKSTPLGFRKLVKCLYPQEPYPTTWERPPKKSGGPSATENVVKPLHPHKPTTKVIPTAVPMSRLPAIQTSPVPTPPTMTRSSSRPTLGPSTSTLKIRLPALATQSASSDTPTPLTPPAVESSGSRTGSVKRRSKPQNLSTAPKRPKNNR